MDRKGIIAVTLAIVTLLAWTFYTQKEVQKAAELARKRAEIEAASKPPTSETPIADAPSGTAPAASAPTVPETPESAVPEQIERVTTPSVEYLFTNLGGGISKVALLKHAAEKDRRMFLNDFGTVPIGAVTFSGDDGARAAHSAKVDATAGLAAFERAMSDQLVLKKTFTAPKASDPEEYLCKLDLTFANGSDRPAVVPGYFIHAGSAAPIHQLDQGIYTGFTYDGAARFVDVNWFSSGGFLFFSHPERPVYPEKPLNLSGIRWAGVTNQYFSTIISPVGMDKAVRGSTAWARRFTIPDAAWSEAGRSAEGKTGARYALDGALGMPPFTVDPGKSVTQSFRIYTGPREYSRLKHLGNDEESIMDFGMFGIVSKTLLNSMNWLNARLGSYAVAIIVLTIVIKLLLWPLQNKATQSMKKMALLQPKMTELREKYADDPTKMNAEVMKLYKDYGVNPFGGCLPMLIQIPIFFGFYNMLGKAVELRNAKFFWVNDLSLPDTIAHLPLLGWPVNVLPLLMAGSMLWSMAISPKSGDPAQQRIFMFMPLIFIFFCYNFASALALYWTVQNLFSVVQLYLTRNQAPPELQKIAAPKKKK